MEFLKQCAEGEPVSQRYLIGQALGGGEVAERAKEASANFGVPVLPFAGVAARLSGPGEPDSDRKVRIGGIKARGITSPSDVPDDVLPCQPGGGGASLEARQASQAV